MTIKQIYDIDEIIPLHQIIFGKYFPLQSFYKKKRCNDVLMFVYEEHNKNIGYSIAIVQAETKSIYAWYGGVIPKYQGVGITKKFFEMLIEYAKKISYQTITVATSNLRPHMITFAVKMGFDIYDIKKRETGEGNKIYFRYVVQPESTKIINLSENIRIVDIERTLVELYKNNTTTLILSNIHDIEVLMYIVNYCNNFIRRPKLILTKEEDFFTKSTLELLKEYKGEIEFKI